MLQPEVKWRFVERYCNPNQGWEVFVDIDASEIGNTGGPRVTEVARIRQQKMQIRGDLARKGMEILGVQVGGSRQSWISTVRDKYVGKTLPEVMED